MTMQATFDIINTAGVVQSQVDLLKDVATEALRRWDAALAGNAKLNIRIEITTAVASHRADGTWANGSTAAQDGDFSYAVGSPAWQLQGNKRVGGSSDADIVISIDPDYLQNELFLDPTPETRGPIPTEKTDGLSVLMHEIGHALGFTGYYQENTNSFSDNFKTGYDYRVSLVDGAVMFDGPNVRALMGSAIPLTNDNYAHYGNSNAYPGTDPDPLLGLMNGVVYYRGYAYTISALDLAVLADTGVGTKRDDILDLPFLPSMRGGAGNDRITGGSTANLLQGDAGNDLVRGNAGADVLKGGNGKDRLFGGRDGDKLYGGAGADSLSGGKGHDILTGGSGADRFVFDDALTPGSRDVIADFSHADGDRIVLSLAMMPGLQATGPLGAAAFHAAPGATAAHDSSDRIIYDTTSGTLSYDPDGSGGASPVALAILHDHPALLASDFLIVA